MARIIAERTEARNFHRRSIGLAAHGRTALRKRVRRPQRDARVVYLLVSGVYFDDAEKLSGLLTSHLEKLDAFAIGG